MVFNTNTLKSSYVSLAVLLSFLVTFTGLYAFNALYMFVAICTIIFYRRLDKVLLILIVVFTISFGVVSLANSAVHFERLVYGISGMILGYTICHMKVNEYLLKPFYLFLCLFPLIVYVTNYEISDLFVESSRNIHSLLILTLLSTLLFSRSKIKNINFYVFLGIVSLPIFGSRAAAVSSFVLVLYYVSQSQLSYAKKLLFYLFLTGILVSLLYLGFFESILQRFESQGAVDYGRFAVLQCYFNSVSIESFVLGLNYPNNSICGTKAIGTFAPHNSYLSAFIYSGVFAFVIVFLVFNTGAGLLKRDAIYFFVFSAFMVRCFTDDAIFFNRFDYIFWAFVFYLRREESSSQQEPS